MHSSIDSSRWWIKWASREPLLHTRSRPIFPLGLSYIWDAGWWRWEHPHLSRRRRRNIISTGEIKMPATLEAFLSAAAVNKTLACGNQKTKNATSSSPDFQKLLRNNFANWRSNGISPMHFRAASSFVNSNFLDKTNPKIGPKLCNFSSSSSWVHFKFVEKGKCRTNEALHLLCRTSATID